MVPCGLQSVVKSFTALKKHCTFIGHCLHMMIKPKTLNWRLRLFCLFEKKHLYTFHKAVLFISLSRRLPLLKISMLKWRLMAISS